MIQAGPPHACSPVSVGVGTGTSPPRQPERRGALLVLRPLQGQELTPGSEGLPFGEQPTATKPENLRTVVSLYSSHFFLKTFISFLFHSLECLYFFKIHFYCETDWGDICEQGRRRFQGDSSAVRRRRVV